ncbi:inositol monophosphatase family protein [Hutsoniella sourekii]
MDYQLHHRIVVWMEEAARRLRASLDQTIQVKEKSDRADLVTNMDRETEAFFVEKIRQYYPDHRILGEEGCSDQPEDHQGMIWLIDPIDGTLNFVKQQNNFGIMIGLFEDGQPVAGYIYNVMPGDLYYGIVGEGAYLNHQPLEPLAIDSLSQGLIIGNIGNFADNKLNINALLATSLGARSYGAAALEIISVIRGESALYLSTGLNPWDFGAGYCICEAMGLKVTTHTGQPLDILQKSPVLFASPRIHQEALEILAKQD